MIDTSAPTTPRPLSGEARALAPLETTAFFLDVDGTLLDFKSRPEAVVGDPELIETLDTLFRLAGGALALVSGRMVGDLDRIVAPLLLPAAGAHGADIRFADGTRATVDASMLDALRGEIRDFVDARPGLMLEDKGSTLAIHFRHAPERAFEARHFLQGLTEGRDLMAQDGKLVVELKPSACDKGHAILALMKTKPFAGRRALFIGDDLTDEHGFRAVNDSDGLSIKVGSPDGETVARLALAHVRDVRDFLRNLSRLTGPR
jgi:trehalose 6-phosphate phosphatase